MGSNLSNLSVAEFETIKTKYKVIAKGWINLANPESGYDSVSSRNSIEPKVGEFHDYTVHLQPNLYTVKKGHKLALVFNTYDPSDLTVENPYEVTFKTDSIRATIPIVEGTRSQVATYLPNAADTAYAALPEIQGAKLVAAEIHYKEEYHLPVDPETQGETTSPLPINFGKKFLSLNKGNKTEDQVHLPQTGEQERQFGLYALGGLLLSSLLFWKKKKEDVQG